MALVDVYSQCALFKDTQLKLFGSQFMSNSVQLAP